jgi:serpin B
MILIILLSSVCLLPLQAQAAPVLGDVNDDTVINIIDALMVAQYYVGLNVQGFLEEAADVNNSGNINIIDALLIAQLYVEIITEFPNLNPVAGVEIIKSDVERNMSPTVNSGEVNSIADGNNRFGFDCYQKIREKEIADQNEANLFFSPLSISYAFAMCYAGAAGSTATDIADTMHFTLAEERFHNAYNYLDMILSQTLSSPEMGGDFKLRIANSIWGQRDFFFFPDYLDTLAYNYGAGMNAVDFINNPEGSRVQINDWVSEQTENRINDLIPPGSIDLWTRLVLTNAIYFMANWDSPFEEEDTVDDTFYLTDGSTKQVQMMNQYLWTYYTESPGQYQAVRLKYQGASRNSMIIILPAQGQMANFESNLDTDVFNSIRDNMTTYRVNLDLPKFSYEWNSNINDFLKSLGMILPFNASAADFSRITDEMDLYVSEVIHKAFVSVDEIGTEAAAATAIVMPGGIGPEPTPTPPPLVNMTINRPFLFLIVNENTGTILFLGRVLEPVL